MQYSGANGDADVVVLIETLWNVNRKRKGETGYHCTVLIETLWNVNEPY